MTRDNYALSEVIICKLIPNCEQLLLDNIQYLADITYNIKFPAWTV